MLFRSILVLKKEERSTGNSMQSAGSFMGTLAGSGLLLVVYHFLGWQYLLVCLSLFVVVALVPLLFYRTTASKDVKEQKKAASMTDIISFFRADGMWRRIVILTLFYSGIIGRLGLVYTLSPNYGRLAIRSLATVSLATCSKAERLAWFSSAATITVDFSVL